MLEMVFVFVFHETIPSLTPGLDLSSRSALMVVEMRKTEV